MLAIADTGPLNYLVLIGCIDLLPELYEKVLIPPAVLRELLSPSAPAIVRSWATNLPPWIQQASPSPQSLNDPRWAGLHSGETAALALSGVNQPAILLIDEWSARERALSHRLPVIGTLGILDEAAQSNLISFPAAIEKLKQTSFRYPSPLVERLLARHNLRQGRTQ